MTSRRNMLRSFICEAYAETPLPTIVADLAHVMPEADQVSRLAAAEAALRLPALLELVEATVLGAGVDDHIRGYAGGLLTYVYNPLDLLQEDGVVGWLDDTIVCALGLHRAHEERRIELDEVGLALCQVANIKDDLNCDLRQGIEDFVEGLWVRSEAVSRV